MIRKIKKDKRIINIKELLNGGIEWDFNKLFKKYLL